MQKYDNKCIKCILCCYSGLFCDIMSLNVKMYLWLTLYTVPFFVSGQTYKISKGSNNYSFHCMYLYIWYGYCSQPVIPPQETDPSQNVHRGKCNETRCLYMIMCGVKSWAWLFRIEQVSVKSLLLDINIPPWPGWGKWSYFSISWEKQNRSGVKKERKCLLRTETKGIFVLVRSSSNQPRISFLFLIPVGRKQAPIPSRWFYGTHETFSPNANIFILVTI